ncbi:MAG: hypothetical protein P1S60_00915 [Anaerolineae bacterium]|nr:hypothetical protein [Anaerolineae bacterium]
MRIWDTERGDLVLEVPTLEQTSYHTVAWSPDGTKVSGSSAFIGNWPVFVFDAYTGEQLLSFGNYHGFKYAEWSSDGTRIATGCLYSVDDLCPSRIWDAETGQTLLILDGSYGDTHFLEWSPDGSRLATAHTGGSAIVWDAETGQALTIFSGHDEWVADVTWSPDGKRLASGDIAGIVKGWDSETGEEVFNFEVPGGVMRMDWAPDGQHLVVSGEYNAPIIFPVWQSTEDLISYAYDCCVSRELTPEERSQFLLDE